jgi:hypothetical protein
VSEPGLAAPRIGHDRAMQALSTGDVRELPSLVIWGGDARIRRDPGRLRRARCRPSRSRGLRDSCGAGQPEIPGDRRDRRCRVRRGRVVAAHGRHARRDRALVGSFRRVVGRVRGPRGVRDGVLRGARAGRCPPRARVWRSRADDRDPRRRDRVEYADADDRGDRMGSRGRAARGGRARQRRHVAGRDDGKGASTRVVWRISLWCGWVVHGRRGAPRRHDARVSGRRARVERAVPRVDQPERGRSR